MHAGVVLAAAGEGRARGAAAVGGAGGEARGERGCGVAGAGQQIPAGPAGRVVHRTARVPGTGNGGVRARADAGRGGGGVEGAGEGAAAAGGDPGEEMRQGSGAWVRAGRAGLGRGWFAYNRVWTDLINAV